MVKIGCPQQCEEQTAMAAAEGIISVQLSAGASRSEYMMRFLNQLRFRPAERLTFGVMPLSGSLEEVPPEG